MKRPSWRVTALAAWVYTFIAVAIIVSAKPGMLYRTFADAGDRFRHAESLYRQIEPGRDLYRYSPVVAAALTPLGLMPEPVGAILWRVMLAGSLLLALRAWSRIAVPTVSWPALALLVLPLVVGNLHNGQLNPLVAALMLASAVGFYREKYALAAVAIAVCTFLKVYPLSLGLLFCAIEPRRFAWRLALVLVIGLVLPFAFHSPGYIREQFSDWLLLLSIDDRLDQPMSRGYHDFQKLLLLWGCPISMTAYRAIELAMGAAAAGFVLWGRSRGWDRAKLIQACVALGFLWCTLFGPATESATYMLLAPIAAQAVIAVTGRPAWERAWVYGAFLLLLSAAVIQWFPRPVVDAYRGGVVPQAHAALMLLGWTVWRMWRWEGSFTWRQASRPAEARTGLEACPHT